MALSVPFPDNISALPTPSDRNAPLDFNPMDARVSSEGTQLERSWKVLQNYISKIESVDRDRAMEHRRYVVDRLLSFGYGLGLPPWLIAPFKVRSLEESPVGITLDKALVCSK
jgi:hypothetical protein